MNLEEITLWIKKEVAELTSLNAEELEDSFPLIGAESSLDSMNLVKLCLALEEVSETHGHSFDWTSEKAMSRSNGMFRSIHALAQECENQWNN